MKKLKYLLTVTVGSITATFEKDRIGLDAQLEAYKGIDEVVTTVKEIA